MESDIITHVACDTYPIFKHMSSYIDDLKPHLNGHLIIRMSLFNSVEMHAYVKQWSSSGLKCTQMTVAIGILKNIFLLHNKM